MYHAFWVVCVTVVLAGLGTSNSIDVVYKCPIGCTCSDNAVATCRTLDIVKFSTKVYILKITNPTSSLYLGSDFLRNLGLETINTLLIENAVIEEIDKNAFRGLRDLTHIAIVESNIPDIHPDTFVDCVNLKTLKLTGSRLHKFDSIKSESLEELDLSNCSIKEITNANFDNLSELTYLNLAHNFIAQINLNTFSNVFNLEELYLSHNNITDIPANVFENNTELDTLDLSHNPLRAFRTGKALNIEKLVLKSCRLTEFDAKTAKNLDLLDTLDLSGNNFSYLAPESLSPLTDLQYLDLSNNNIVLLHPDTFKNNTNVQKLILDGNPLKSLVAFNTDVFFKTHHFSCDHCRLTHIDKDMFANMPSIRTLRLSNNELTEVSKALKHLAALNDLDLSNNLIQIIEDAAFEKNQALESLNLSGNPLSSLDSNAFLQNSVLKRLDVSSCGLRNLWSGSQASLFALDQLNIAKNLLRTISQGDLNVTPNLKVLEVRGNPLVCDDSFCDFIRWINDKGVIEPAARKTHLPLKDAAEFQSTGNELTWMSIANETCGGSDSCLDDYDDYEEDLDSSEEYPENPKVYYDNFHDFDKNELDVSEIKISNSTRFIARYSYIWPALVFIFTALLVLLIVANVLLLVLKRRGTIKMPREGLPQIKIIPWSNACKLKKHSGSVYQPLSEEKYGPPTPMINRYEKVPNEPSVHKPTP